MGSSHRGASAQVRLQRMHAREGGLSRQGWLVKNLREETC